MDEDLKASEPAHAARGGTAQHTPGPWVAEESEIYAGERLLAETLPLAGDGPTHEAYGDTELANARLMASAPELFSALSNALIDLRYSLAYANLGSMRYGDLETSIEVAEAAIAKATTRPPPSPLPGATGRLTSPNPPRAAGKDE